MMHFLIKNFILLTFSIIVSSSRGKRLGEQCNYKRLCLDKNAECVGQIAPLEFLKAPEKTIKYVCECKTYYREKDGVCQVKIEFFAGIFLFLIFVFIIIMAILWIKKKVKNGQTDLQEEKTDLKEEQASIIIPENLLPNKKEQSTWSSYALLCLEPVVKRLKALASRLQPSDIKCADYQKAKNGQTDLKEEQMDLKEEQTDLNEEQTSITISENLLPDLNHGKQ